MTYAVECGRVVYIRDEKLFAPLQRIVKEDPEQQDVVAAPSLWAEARLSVCEEVRAFFRDSF